MWEVRVVSGVSLVVLDILGLLCSSGLSLRGLLRGFFSGVLAPPFTPKEAGEDLRPTDSGCQHNITLKSVSLESRGS